MLTALLLSMLTARAHGLPASCNANENETASHQLNIPYQTGSDAQKLDIYTPKSKTKPYKTVMLIHGGCFRWGAKDSEDSKAQIDRLVKAGYAVVSVDYRLADVNEKDPSKSKNTYPASLDDVRDALCWVQDHGKQYGLDSSRIATLGYSAGGTLATYLGTRHTAGSAHKTSCTPKVAGVIDMFGRTDFLTATEPDPSKLDCGEVYAGLSRNEQHPQEIFKELDVLSHIDREHVPPFLVLHGSNDHSVGLKNSKELCAELKGSCEMKVIPGADHMFGGPGEWDKAYDGVCTFLSEKVFPDSNVETAAAHKHPRSSTSTAATSGGASR